MGIYDRDYYQGDDAPRGFTFGSQRRMMVTNIVLVTMAIFILDTFASGGVTAFCGLDINLPYRPWKAFQLLTYGFVHAGVWHIAMNMFMLWMFGRAVEERLGRMEVLLFYLVAIVFSGVIWDIAEVAWLLRSEQGRLALSVINMLPAFSSKIPQVIGASGGVVAVFILFVLYNPKQTIYLLGIVAVPAWLVGALVIGQDVLLAATGSAGVTAWQAHLGGAAFAFLYIQLRWNLSRPLGGTGWTLKKLRRRGPKLRIHNPDDDQDLAAEADRILAKMHREGEQSLTNRERKTLEKYSRRVRERRR